MCGEEKKVTGLCVCEKVAKNLLKQATGMQKKDIHPLHFYLLFLILFLFPYFLRGLGNIGLGHGTRRESGRTREEALSVDAEEEEKARDEERRELGTRFDPCLLINLSERDRKGA